MYEQFSSLENLNIISTQHLKKVVITGIINSVETAIYKNNSNPEMEGIRLKVKTEIDISPKLRTNIKNTERKFKNNAKDYEKNIYDLLSNEKYTLSPSFATDLQHTEKAYTVFFTAKTKKLKTTDVPFKL